MEQSGKDWLVQPYYKFDTEFSCKIVTLTLTLFTLTLTLILETVQASKRRKSITSTGMRTSPSTNRWSQIQHEQTHTGIVPLLSICLFGSLSVCLSVCLRVCLSVCSRTGDLRHSDNKHIQCNFFHWHSNSAWYHQVHWLSGTPYLSIITSNVFFFQKRHIWEQCSYQRQSGSRHWSWNR